MIQNCFFTYLTWTNLANLSETKNLACQVNKTYPGTWVNGCCGCFDRNYNHNGGDNVKKIYMISMLYEILLKKL